MKVKVVLSIVAVCGILSCKNQVEPTTDQLESGKQHTHATEASSNESSDNKSDLAQLGEADSLSNNTTDVINDASIVPDTTKEYIFKDTLRAPSSPPTPETSTHTSKKSSKRPQKAVQSPASILIDSILFKQFNHSFDTIQAGAIVKHKFYFVNKNKTAIEVAKTVPECGCTTPSFPFLPIPSGDSAFIGVTFNSIGKIDYQDAQVHVHFKDVKDKITLHMKGLVVEDKSSK